MIIFNYRSVANQFMSTFKENLTFRLSALQEKVALVALIALSYALTYCLLYRFFFKWNAQQVTPSQKEDSILDAHKIEELEKKQNILNLSLSDYIQQSTNMKCKTYLSLLCKGTELNNLADISFKNASSLEDTRVILIGDTHTIRSHLEIQHFIIDRFGRNDDVHLVEGAEGEIERIFEHMDTYGWDNMKIFNKGKIVIKEILNLRKRTLHPEMFPNEKKLSEQERNKKISFLKKKFLTACQQRTESLIKCLNESVLKL